MSPNIYIYTHVYEHMFGDFGYLTIHYMVKICEKYMYTKLIPQKVRFIRKIIIGYLFPQQ